MSRRIKRYRWAIATIRDMRRRNWMHVDVRWVDEPTGYRTVQLHAQSVDKELRLPRQSAMLRALAWLPLSYKLSPCGKFITVELSNWLWGWIEGVEI